MKIAPVADVKARLSAYIAQCEAEGPIVITRNGKAVVVLIAPEDNEDLERIIVGRSPRLRAVLAKSRRSLKAGKGLSHDAFWRTVAARRGKDMSMEVISRSQYYTGKPYWYWWDVWDERKQAVAQAGALTLVQKDTGRKATVRAQDLLLLLTDERRTSRCQKLRKSGKGNWGLYVRPNRPDEIEIEAGQHGTRAVIRVRWEM